MEFLMLGGSISRSFISSELKGRLYRFFEENINVEYLVGDARGIDSLFQDMLLELHIEGVTVFHMGESARNNRWNWPRLKVPDGKEKKYTREWYTQKDIRMCEMCDRGLFLWDLKSKGTQRNINQLISEGKPVYLNLKHQEDFVCLEGLEAAEDFRILQNAL